MPARRFRAITRSQANGAASPEASKPVAQSSPDSSKRQRTVSRVDNAIQAGDNQQSTDPATNKEPVELISNIEEMTLNASTQMGASSSGFSGFIEPDDVSTESIQISVPSSYRLTRKASIKHKGSQLQLCCMGLQHPLYSQRLNGEAATYGTDINQKQASSAARFQQGRCRGAGLSVCSREHGGRVLLSGTTPSVPKYLTRLTF
uniref:Uncharacterized protein n=1 Tax=Leersia perrieri TaxID=77586 RepID=A0A0D9XJK5_9ORYZ